tara:strand:+ start:1582 stop:1770 length:189 start_codon:yes stop_codon:yes gene_type:complete
MSIDDPFPMIDEALVLRLREMYPEKCPSINDSDRQIWYDCGQISVVKMLESVYNEQNNINED